METGSIPLLKYLYFLCSHTNKMSHIKCPIILKTAIPVKAKYLSYLEEAIVNWIFQHKPVHEGQL